MGTPSAALAIQPTPSPLDQISKLVSLKSLLQNQQVQEQAAQRAQGVYPAQLQAAQAGAQLAQTQAKDAQLVFQSKQGVTRALIDAAGFGPSGQPSASGAATPMAPSAGSLTPSAAPSAPPSVPSSATAPSPAAALAPAAGPLAAGGSASAPAAAPAPTAAAGSGGDVWGKFLQNLSNPAYGVLPQDAFAIRNEYLQLGKTMAQKTSADLAAEQAVNQRLAQYGDAVLAAPAAQQPQAYQQALSALANDPSAAVRTAVSQLPQQFPGAQQLQLTLAHMKTVEDVVAQQKQANEAPGQVATSQLAAQKADIVQQLSSPAALASPGAQAAIEAKINDPATPQADIARLQLLLPKAGVAQQQALALKTRALQAQQLVQQGDPAAAGALLASRALTLDELRLRNATPQFMESAVSAAQKIDPGFKAAESSAQGKIAGSSANQQFFGNTDSLLTHQGPQGGTLDQLQKAATGLPAGKFPALNSIAQWTKASVGSGPLSRFAAAALGVADDYSKVMTGNGGGSDTSRMQALNIIKGAQSPQQMQAAIDQIRQQVQSQREGRLGSNPYLRDMYPDPAAQGARPGAQQPTSGRPSIVGPNGHTLVLSPDGKSWVEPAGGGQ